MSPRKEGNAPPTLSPVRPALAGHSRLSVNGGLTPSADTSDPFRAVSPLPSLSRRTSHLDLNRATPSLALTQETALGDEEQVTVEGAAALEGARDLLRAQLKRSDTARLQRKKSGLPQNDRSRPHTPLVDTIAATAPPASTVTAERRAPRRYYILTSAGKPVFCSHPDDEDAMSSQVGVMQAIISIFADEGSHLRTVVADTLRISFLLKAPLYYVAVSEWAEPDSVLRLHLEYLHMHVVSVTSGTQLQRIFQQHKNFDLRRLLGGTEGQLDALVAKLQYDLALMTNALDVYKVDGVVREKVAHALLPLNEQESALYVIVLAAGRIVTLLRPKRHSVHPSDLHLLVNTILSSPSLLKPGAEAWIPVCLPRFNSTGFLHAFVSYLSVHVGLVLVSNNREAFFTVREWKQTVADRLKRDKLIDQLEAAVEHQSISLGGLGIPGLRHFLYKSRPYVQIVSPAWEGVYTEVAEQQKLVMLYHKTYDQLHRRPPATASGRQPAKLVYFRTEQEAILGWASQAFEIYLSVTPLLPKAAVVAAAHSLLRWARQHESRLFLANAPTF